MESDQNKQGGKPLFQEQRKRICGFCKSKMDQVDYKEVAALRPFVSDLGKIVPRRISGNCARHQRGVTRAIKRARNIALLALSDAP